MDVGSQARYRKFLERVWGFESSVEMHASTIAGVERAAAGARLRIGRLHEDLLALGLSPLEIAALPRAAVEIGSASEAFGWLMAIERHVLLAGLIRRHLAARLQGGFAAGSRYFDTHRDGGTRFREFAEVVSDAIDHGLARPDAIVTAAKLAFDAQHGWYSRLLSLGRPRAEPRAA